MSTKIDNALFKALRPALTEAINAVGTQLGISITLGNGSYTRDGTSGVLKLDLSAVAADGTVVNTEAGHFKQLARAYGFEPGDLGREFTANGKRHRISGLRIKAKSKPILTVEVASGREYIWPVDTVKLYLDREPKPVA